MDQTGRSRFRSFCVALFIAGNALAALAPRAWSRSDRASAGSDPSRMWSSSDVATAPNSAAGLDLETAIAGDFDTPRGNIRTVPHRSSFMERILAREQEKDQHEHADKPATTQPTSAPADEPSTSESSTAVATHETTPAAGDRPTPTFSGPATDSGHAEAAKPVETASAQTTEKPASTESSTPVVKASHVRDGDIVSDTVPGVAANQPISIEGNDEGAETGNESTGASAKKPEAETPGKMNSADSVPIVKVAEKGPNHSTAPESKSGEPRLADTKPTTVAPQHAPTLIAEKSTPPVKSTPVAASNPPTHSTMRTVADVEGPIAIKPIPGAAGPMQSLEPLTVTIKPTNEALAMAGDESKGLKTDGGMISGGKTQPAGPMVSMPAGAAEIGSSSTVESDEKIIASIKVNPMAANVITLTKSTSAVIELHGDIDRAEIGNPQVASIFVTSPTRLVVIGRAVGTTELTIQMGKMQRVLSIVVEMDLKPLRTMIASVAPTAQVMPRAVNGVIVLTGTVPDAQTAEKLGELATLYETGKVQNQLRVAGVQQTNLRCMVAEVNKRALRQLGVNWGVGGSKWTRDFFLANNLGQLNPTTIGSSGVANVLTGQQLYNIGAVANGTNTNLTFGFPRAELQFFVNALRENNLFRVLAEPNLTAISGQTASFLAGGEVPIPVTQGGATAGSITIEYKEFGVRLHFTPTIVGRQVIRLHVLTEFSDAVPSTALAGGLPTFSFTTRRVESTVECGNGQTFAIAGLLSERVQAVASKIPGLGDVPVLGALFNSVDYQKSNTELVILVTPELVQALDPQQVGPPPGALMTDPDDFELFGLGQLEGPENERPDMDRVPRHEQDPMSKPPKRGTCCEPKMHGPTGAAEFDE